MRRNISVWTAMVATSSILLVSHAKAEEKFHATLSGFEEIGSLSGPTGAIFSPGNDAERHLPAEFSRLITAKAAFAVAPSFAPLARHD